jgi:hypothetical protein
MAANQHVAETKGGSFTKFLYENESRFYILLRVSVTEFGLVIGFINNLQVVITINYCLFACFCRYCYIAAERTWTYSKRISRDRYPAYLLARRSDLQKIQRPLFLRVGPCLQSCCLATS